MHLCLFYLSIGCIASSHCYSSQPVVLAVCGKISFSYWVLFSNNSGKTGKPCFSSLLFLLNEPPALCERLRDRRLV